MTIYKVEIYGENCEDETSTFETLSQAIEYVEKKTTDDSPGWEMKEGRIEYIDYNKGLGTIINEIIATTE